MNDNWSDFEKRIWDKLEKLSDQVSALRAQAAMVAAITSVAGVAVCEMIIRAWAK